MDNERETEVAAPGSNEIAEVVIERLRRIGARRILDVGCGSGKLAGQLVAAAFEVTGIDPLESAIEQARLTVPQGKFVLGGAEDLGSWLERFDAVLFVNALHHIPIDRMERALLDGLGLLQAEGQLLVVEPLSSGSFYLTMLPIEDETVIRERAVATVEKVIASARADLVELYRWDRESIFGSLGEFVARLVDVDPDRVLKPPANLVPVQVHRRPADRDHVEVLSHVGFSSRSLAR